MLNLNNTMSSRGLRTLRPGIVSEAPAPTSFSPAELCVGPSADHELSMPGRFPHDLA